MLRCLFLIWSNIVQTVSPATRLHRFTSWSMTSSWTNFSCTSSSNLKRINSHKFYDWQKTVRENLHSPFWVNCKVAMALKFLFYWRKCFEWFQCSENLKTKSVCNHWIVRIPLKIQSKYPVSFRQSWTSLTYFWKLWK